MIIGSLERRDIDQVSALAARCFSTPWSAKAFEELLEDENSLFLVAREDGEVIGGCGVTNILGDGEINNVMVEASRRGRGIATRLLEELLARGCKMGIRQYTLEVRAGNLPALRVYEKLGFVREGIRPGFYEKPREDALILWKRQ